MNAVKSLWFGKIVAPARLRLFVWLSLVTQVLIVVTGGAVRLTGSGLGCPTWPKCTEDSLVSTAEMGFHGLIEFGNRVLTIVLLIVALLTFIVVVRNATPTRKIGKLSIGFFSGAILLVVGLVANEILSLLALTVGIFAAAFILMLGFGVLIVKTARTESRHGLVVPAFILGVGIILQAVVGGITVLTGLNSWIVGVHFVISMGLIAVASLLVWRALPKPESQISAITAQLAWPISVFGTLSILFGVVVTGAGPHAGDAETPRNGLNLEIWQHFHSYPGYILLALIVISVISQSRISGFRLRLLPMRILLILLAVTVLQAVVGIVQARTGVPALLVGFHMLGAAVLASLLAFQQFSGRKISR
ncbi:MAG: COX15/CtaA family protein [Aquiluna sp.]|nr:COX15/CtaA family protein [Aquiluna sp.]